MLLRFADLLACKTRGAGLKDDSTLPLGSIEMNENFDKRMALDVIEDALTSLGTPRNCGCALGLCGAFYMCGLLNHAEWVAFMNRIPKNQDWFQDWLSDIDPQDLSET